VYAELLEEKLTGRNHLRKADPVFAPGGPLAAA
jgi:hypothetical protein